MMSSPALQTETEAVTDDVAAGEASADTE